MKFDILDTYKTEAGLHIWFQVVHFDNGLTFVKTVVSGDNYNIYFLVAGTSGRYA